MNQSPVTPSLYVPNLDAALHFYTHTLGFTKTDTFEEDGKTYWAEVTLGEARLWFFANALDDIPEPTFSGLIYVLVDNVDKLVKQLEGHTLFEWGPETQPYGLRELGIKDLNGYYLVFAQEV